jgi:hypothetical protein
LPRPQIFGSEEMGVADEGRWGAVGSGEGRGHPAF